MAHSDPVRTRPRPEDAPADEEQYRQIWRGLGSFADRSAPWLFETGIWIFGSLIAFNLLIIASLITVGPVDTAVRLATAAFALALPLNVAGLILLRLTKETRDARLEDELAQAFEEAGVVSDQIPKPPELEAMRKKRAGIVLISSPGILAVCVLLTLVGTAATLWHMAWWIAVSFCAMIVLSVFIVVLAMGASQPSQSQEQTAQTRREEARLRKRAQDQPHKHKQGT